MEQPGTSPGAVSGEPTLQRTIGLWQMTLYGADSMLGAGIYGLLGQVAAEMGSAVWLAFALSMVAAGLTGLSYASLGSRYPRAGRCRFHHRDVPRSGHLDDYIQFAVDLPPGCERGPLIDRPLHIRAGALSAAKYRLALSLSFW